MLLQINRQLPLSINLFRSAKKYVKSRHTKSSLPKLKVWRGITVKELAKYSDRDTRLILDVVRNSLVSNKKVNADSEINDTSFLHRLVNALGYQPTIEIKTDEKEIKDLDAYPEGINIDALVHRPPVVAVMGHVDHGKTTLLDAIRSTNVVENEYGGITQHLSAFTLCVDKSRTILGDLKVSAPPTSPFDHITFLDTPGHATFSAMRARGARVTDIVILVVAGDDGVMPQTVEAIRFAQQANAQLVVAINKMDKKNADASLVIDELASHGVVTEPLGGSVQCVEISALKKTNLLHLFDAVVAQAEMLEIKADPTGFCEAVVLESRTLHGLGKAATLLVTKGVLTKPKADDGHVLVAAECTCRPRLLFADNGEKVNQVLPGFVADVIGWQELPSAGDLVLTVESEARAREVIRFRKSRKLVDRAAVDRPSEEEADPLSLSPEMLKLPIILKTDTDGSLEAIRGMLTTFPSDIADVTLAHSGVGPLTDSEVRLADSLKAPIFLFNMRALKKAEELVKESNVALFEHQVIYHLANKISQLVTERLPPLRKDKIVGEAIVLQMFEITESKNRKVKIPVAGSRCVAGNLLYSGTLPREEGHPDPGIVYYRVLREENASTGNQGSSFRLIADCLLARSLRHRQQDVELIKTNVECGIALSSLSQGNLEAFNDIRVGDRIECYEVIEEPQEFSWDSGFTPD